MFEALPERIDPERDVPRGRCFRGVIHLARLRRLTEALLDDHGEVVVELCLGRDAERVPYLQGEARTVVAMTCQRCTEPVEFPLEANFRLGLVESEGMAGRLPEGYEPLLVGDEPFALAPVVEDELLLALPLVPKHEICQPPAPAGEEVAQASEPVRRENPFAVLADLKRDR